MAARFVGPLPIGYGLKKAMVDAVGLESALAEVSKYADLTADQLPVVKKQILDLSSEMGVAFEEIAKAYARGGQFGVPLEKLEQFARDTAKVSAAFGDMSEEQTATALAKLSNALQVPHERVMQLADAINHLAGAGASSESGVTRFMLDAAGSARSFGLAAEETAAFGAAFESLGMEPAKAARFFGLALNTLSAAEAFKPKQRKAMERLGLDVKAFGAAVEEDALSALMEFWEALRDSPTRDAAIIDLFGVEWADEAKLALGALSEVYKTLKLVSDPSNYRGGIDRVFDVAMSTTEKRIARFKQTLRNTWTELAEAGLPALNAGLERGLSALEGFNKIKGELAAAWKIGMDMGELGEAKSAAQVLADLLERITGEHKISMDGGELYRTVKDVAEATRQIITFLDQMEKRLGDPEGKRLTEYGDHGTNLLDSRREEIAEHRSTMDWLRSEFLGGAIPDWLIPTDPIFKPDWWDEEAAKMDARRSNPRAAEDFSMRAYTELLQAGWGMSMKPMKSPRGIAGGYDPALEGGDWGAGAAGIPLPVARPIEVPVEPTISEEAFARLQQAIQNRIQSNFDMRSLLETDAARVANLLGSRVPTTFTLPGNIIPPEMLSPELTLETSQFRAAAEGAAALLVEMSRAGAASMTLDTSGYAGPANTALGKRAELERPIRSTADVDISPALSKLAQLRAEAARTGAAVSASLRSGGGRAAYKSALDTQFAPATGRTSA
jgi:TP901 family phage tail tape measure protein